MAQIPVLELSHIKDGGPHRAMVPDMRNLLEDRTAEGPGPVQAPARYCASCGTVMLLARVAPAVWSLPELQTFRCPTCGAVFTWEVDHGCGPH